MRLILYLRCDDDDDDDPDFHLLLLSIRIYKEEKKYKIIDAPYIYLLNWIFANRTHGKIVFIYELKCDAAGAFVLMELFFSDIVALTFFCNFFSFFFASPILPLPRFLYLYLSALMRARALPENCLRYGLHDDDDDDESFNGVYARASSRSDAHIFLISLRAQWIICGMYCVILL